MNVTLAAHEACDQAAFERAVFAQFDRAIGFDLALFVRDGAFGGFTPSLDPRTKAVYSRRQHVYAKELAPFTAATIAAGGVGVDTEFFNRRSLEQTAYHTELVRPLGGRSSLVGILQLGGRVAGVLVLGRTRHARFREREKKALRDVLPELAVADMAMRCVAKSAGVANALTPREREIVGYLRLGYSNREIALACGTSFRTVRNQLSAVYEKLDVSNRTEALARLLER